MAIRVIYLLHERIERVPKAALANEFKGCAGHPLQHILFAHARVHLDSDALF